MKSISYTPVHGVHDSCEQNYHHHADNASVFLVQVQNRLALVLLHDYHIAISVGWLVKIWEFHVSSECVGPWTLKLAILNSFGLHLMRHVLCHIPFKLHSSQVIDFILKNCSVCGDGLLERIRVDPVMVIHKVEEFISNVFDT